MKNDGWMLAGLFLLIAIVAGGFGYSAYLSEKRETAECEQRNGIYVCHSDTVWVGGKLGVVETCRCEPRVFR